MPPPTNPTPFTEQVSAFFQRFRGNAKDPPKAGWLDFHAALKKFNAKHPPDEQHLDLIRAVLARGIRLLQAALGWEEPVAGGKSTAPTDTDRDRGAQWRFVMAFAGFEMVARGVLNCGKSGLGKDDFEKLVKAAVLAPNCPAIPCPQAAPKIVAEWLSPVGAADPPILAFLNLKDNPTKQIRDWLIDGNDRATWVSVLGMAQCLRHSTAHGFLSASKIGELKIVPLLNEFVLRLEDVVTGVLRRMNET